MKLNGKKVEGLNEEIIVIPRGGEDGDIVFRARAVVDMSDINRLCTRPTPPIIRRRDGIKVEDVDDARYKAKLEDYSTKFMAYMVIKSLEATEQLEWENVNINDPATWKNYESELKESGFSQIEINHIVNGVMTANCLNEKKLEEARNRFLAGLRDQAQQKSSRNIDQQNTESGEPANASN